MAQDALEGGRHGERSVGAFPLPRRRAGARVLTGGARHAPALLFALIIAVAMWRVARAFVVVGIQHHASSAFAGSAAWGLLLFASFAGWGSAVDFVAARSPRADWGLRCAWGWGACVFVGGVLCLLGCAKRAELVGVVALGLLMLFAAVSRDYVRWRRRSNWRRARVWYSELPFAVGAAAILTLGVVQYLWSIRPAGINGDDDMVCYFAFVQEILDRGTLTQPFSLRRISAYGAKSILDAFQVAIPVPIAHLRAVDEGLAVLGVMVLVLGHLRESRRAARAVGLLLLLLVVSVPDIRFNTATTLTGVVFFLGLYRTVLWRSSGRSTGGRLRAELPVAVLAAGACALRQNYLAPVGVFLLLVYGGPIVADLRRAIGRVRDRWSRRRRCEETGAAAPGPTAVWRSTSIRDALAAAAMLVLALAPWWALSWRWCHTFLYPFVKGTFSREYPLFDPLGKFEKMRYLWSNVSYCLPVKAVPLFLIAGLTVRARRAGHALACFMLAAFAGFATLVATVPTADAANLGRYYLGFTFAALIAIALSVADLAGRRVGTRRERSARGAALVLIIAGIALQTYGDREDLARRVDTYLSDLQPLYEKPTAWAPLEQDKTYETLQHAVPAGSSIVVMVDNPYLLDFARNPIAMLDIVGAVSPAPGLPLFRGANAMADYFVHLGYRYAIVVEPTAALSLYRRDKWLQNKNGGVVLWQRSAPYYLAAFDAFDELRATRVHYADVGGMSTIDLEQRR